MAGQQRDDFISTLYDLDNFRAKANSCPWPGEFDFETRLGKAKSNDNALLELALDWVKLVMGGMDHEP